MISDKGAIAGEARRAGFKAAAVVAVAALAAGAGVLVWMGAGAHRPEGTNAPERAVVRARVTDTSVALREERDRYRAMCAAAARLAESDTHPEEALAQSRALAAQCAAMAARVRAMPAPGRGFDPRMGVLRCLEERRGYFLALCKLWESRARLDAARRAIPDAERTAGALTREAGMNPAVGGTAAQARAELARLRRTVQVCEAQEEGLARACAEAYRRATQASSVWRAF